MPSTEFLERMAGGGDAEPPPREWNARVGEKPDPSETDVDYWMKMFGGDEKTDLEGD
jgi:hypothetical protein